MIFPIIDWHERARDAEKVRDETLSFCAALLVAAGLADREVRVLPKHLQDGPLTIHRYEDPKDGALVVRVEKRA